MAEDAQQKKDDQLPPPISRQVEPEDKSEEHSKQFTPSQPSKEKLYQQRQKCELRRILKHTHPELKMLSDVVDEELAEVLSSEAGLTAAETGYEGEVLSRRLIFENCALSGKVSPYSPKIHMAQETVERGDVSKTSAVFEQTEEKCCAARVKAMVGADETVASSPDPNIECEEEIRIDVKATRRIFESQSENTSRKNPVNKLQKQKQEFEMCSKDNLPGKNLTMNLTEQPCKQGRCVDNAFEDDAASLQDPEGSEEIIETNVALFQNNPFITKNIESQQSHAEISKPHIQAGDSGAAEDYPIAQVKNRAHLFESMPFDKIRHQNKDDIETMSEKIVESLNSIHHVNAIHSNGSIIEVNETMIAKMAKFTLSEGGPEIKNDEVAEGTSQNFILHLLPRAHLKPQITYLKEDRKGNMEATMVKVPVHQRQFATSQDTEVKTANVAQRVEDILNQDNSLRKGVIIQEGINKCADIIVYSLYKYVDEEDVRTYRPLQEDSDEPEATRGLINGVIESPMSSLQETPLNQTFPGSEITVKGNVKLFKSCIEKGDLEYLKTLQAEPTSQEENHPPEQTEGLGLELPPDQIGDLLVETTSEWVPVDVKRLKSMFSGDQVQTQAKQNIYNSHTQSTTTSSPAVNMPLGNGPSSTDSNIENFRECGTQAQKKSRDPPIVFHLNTQDDDMVHQAELVQLVDDNDEIVNLQTAIHSLKQATMEAKSFQHSSQQNILVDESSEGSVASVITPDVNSVKTQRTKAEETTSSISSEHKPVNPHVKTITSEEMNTAETCSQKGQKNTEVVQKTFETAMVSSNISGATVAQQEDEEVVFQGKLKAALHSLEKSNINVTRGDFRAAMIYRNSSKSTKETLQSVDAVSVQKTGNNESVTGAAEEVMAANEELPSQKETPNKQAGSAASKKTRRPVGPKPTLPPKPEHLKVKHNENRSNHTEISQTKNNNITSEIKNLIKEEKPFPSSHMPEKAGQDLIVIKSGADSGEDLSAHERPSGNQLLTPKVSQEIPVNQQIQGSVVTMERDNADIINPQGEINEAAQEKSPENIPVKDEVNETDEKPVDFNEACKKFGGKKAFSVKNVPVKPKRVRIAQPNTENILRDNNPNVPEHINAEPQRNLQDRSCNIPSGQTDDRNDAVEREIKQENKVEMREKKGRSETEDERRQRLSVHMDEIVRGNVTAAMEIFDNLRKQEELRSILSRVEEIDQDTSQVEVRSLRGVFENVPDWVVNSNERKQKKVASEQKEEMSPVSRDNTESKFTMAHVFGDLERASEEIINLKDQTLARLLDIEEAIKKALYSVSTLKSDSDIAGLSCLFKESLGAVDAAPSSGNIRKISIGSSRTKSMPTQESPSTQTSLPCVQGASLDIASAKQRTSPTSSPAFISIQSAARKMDKTELLPPETTTCPTCQHSPKTEGKFRTTKILQCNSPAQIRKGDPRKVDQKQPACCPLHPKRELGVFEGQTSEGNNILGTKTVTENYERTDTCGNRFYSSKTSTVVTTQPDTKTSSTGPVAISPATYQITTYPEVRLPINQKP